MGGNATVDREPYRLASCGPIVRMRVREPNVGGIRSHANRLVVLVVIALGMALVTATSVAANPKPLSGVVLANTLPGFIPATPGVTNGPITANSLRLLLGGNSDPAIAQDLADGEMQGYVRAWTPQPANGDGVIIEIFRFADGGQVFSFLSGVDAGVEHVAGPSDFNVPGVTGALGFTLQPASSPFHIPEYAVTFGKGDFAIDVLVASVTRSLSRADAILVATKQADAIEGSPPTASSFGAYQFGEVFGGLLVIVVIVGIVVIVVQRSRQTARALAASPGKYPPPPTAGPREPGWYSVGSNPNEQAYWDGTAWTGRRLWSGSGWV